jgi:hypothetical protein
MFEKEAEEYAKQNNPAEYGVRATHFTVLNSFKDGAEFGYNKAKEETQELGLALQSDMDKTIEQNIVLKKQIEKMKNVLQRWYNQHSDKTYTRTFYDELIKATEEF